MAKKLEGIGAKVKEAAGKAIDSPALKKEGREQGKAARAEERASKAKASAREHRSKAKKA